MIAKEAVMFYRGYPIDWQGAGIYRLYQIDNNNYEYRRLMTVEDFENSIRLSIPMRSVVFGDLAALPDEETL